MLRRSQDVKDRKLRRNFELGKKDIQIFHDHGKASVTRTDKILNSRTAKDSQGLVRTCQVLDQSLQVPLLALQVLDQSLPVLGNPGDTLPRTGTQKKSKTNSEVIRAK